MANASLSFPRETDEFLPLDVRDKGQAVTSFETALLRSGTRPTEGDWLNAVVVEGELGLRVQGLDRGTYGIWVRVPGTSETPVVGPADHDGPGYINIT